MKIAIVGLGGSYSDYIAARIRSETFDETWGINCIGGIIERSEERRVGKECRVMWGAEQNEREEDVVHTREAP